jgi:deazaflavin-dependent oxidoreductase (nitroreductase family)
MPQKLDPVTSATTSGGAAFHVARVSSGRIHDPAAASGLAGSLRRVSDWNAAIIDEFRANGGKVGGQFEGAPMLLLHTTGARTGRERVNPVVYASDGDNLVIFASKGGAPTHPDWYHNLVANPEVTVEVGAGTVPVRARVADGDERERLWSRQVEVMPGFAEYQSKTDRTIPVVVLEQRSS